MTIERYDFADADTLLDALAEKLGRTLAEAIARRGTASLVVSGGRTPEALFGRLAGLDIDWAKVGVTLADERWVPPSDPASNEAMVRRTLLTGRAATAGFVPLYTGHATPEEGEADCAEALRHLPRPFDALILGMGDDGHTASLFPGAPTLAEALAGPAVCRAVRAPGAPQPRITLTLPTLLESRRIHLLVTGAGKRAALEAALAAGPVEAMPVRAVLRQDRVPVEIHWAP
ncbi:MAG TPA: 6-phosphogluconolactonase [Arenibaculum sp.]|nr:6-phosphogluconolactonase [Arenibaculum sp.]